MLILSRNYESLRILIYLCGRPGFEASTRETAEALSIPLTVCRNRVMHLCEAGFLAGERGYGGGVKLLIDPSNIHIGDVVAAIEAQRRQTGDVDPGYKPFFERAARRFLAELNRMTVLDVCPSCRPIDAVAGQSCSCAEPRET
jgi:Rrf2 family nitric oxide-sensitive transcriptional repressor